MFSDREKQLFLVLVLGLVVAIFVLIGIVQYGTMLSQKEFIEHKDNFSQQVVKTEEKVIIEKPSISPWVGYENKDAGFGFEYLRLYDENSNFSSCKIEQKKEGSFAMGEIGINVVSSDGLDLGTFMRDFLLPKIAAPHNWKIKSEELVFVGKRRSIKITYLFGEERRYAEAVFVPDGDRIFIVSFAKADFLCKEGEAFPHLLRTFTLQEKI
jgi:hypothetical protein